MRIRLDGKVQHRRALWLEGDKVRMIDQRLLPHQVVLLDIFNCEDMAEAIRNMTVRGAPAIGAAAAYGMVLAKNQGMDLEEAAKLLKSTRPTAHDLFFAVDFMVETMANGEDAKEAANRYAETIVEKCRLIGEHGEGLITNGARVMTHCNAGALATLDHGTALAPIRAAWRK